MNYGIDDMGKILTRSLGYSRITYDSCKGNVEQIYVKVCRDKNGKIVRKMVQLIDAINGNIRFMSEVRTWRQHALQQYERDVDGKDFLTIVTSGNGHGHHFYGKNIAYYNRGRMRFRMADISFSMREDFRALYIGRRLEKEEEFERLSAYPELKQFVPWTVYVVMACTVLLFYFTWRDASPYGYTAWDVLVNGQSYRLFSYIFAHNGFVHLIGNMVSLFIAGRLYAKVEGNINFIAVYIGGGVLAALMDCYYEAYIGGEALVMTVGASGSIFAIMGALLTETFMNHDMEGRRIRYVLYVLICFVCSSVGSGVNGMVHLFGIVSGILLGLIVGLGEEAILDRKRTFWGKVGLKYREKIKKKKTNTAWYAYRV